MKSAIFGAKVAKLSPTDFVGPEKKMRGEIMNYDFIEKRTFEDTEIYEQLNSERNYLKRVIYHWSYFYDEFSNFYSSIEKESSRFSKLKSYDEEILMKFFSQLKKLRKTIERQWNNAKEREQSILDTIKKQEEEFYPENELMSCPFCGGEATIKKDVDQFAVGCCNDSCRCFIGFSLLYPNQEEAINAWNRRANDDKVDRQ